jgi:hypothetical protein
MRLFLILLFSSIAVLVDAQERGHSIMFEDQGKEYDQLTNVPAAAANTQGDACMEMSRQIEHLKGKPQRRHALMQRYRMECQRGEPDLQPGLDLSQ